MYSLFTSSDVFQTISDIRIYKSRIKYMERLFEKYENKNFGDTLLNEAHQIFNNQMSHICACGSFLTFQTLESDNTVGRLSNGSFCRQRVCPLCQRRKSLKLYSNMLQILEPIKNKNAFLHLTLTVPNVPLWEMPSEITKIFNSSKALFNSERIKKSFKGVIRSLEVTYNKRTKELHPHLHCLVVVNKSYFTSRNYIKFEELRKIWGNIIGVASPEISIRKCTSLEDCVRETVKYAAKPIDLEAKNLDGFTDDEAIMYYMSVAYSLRNRRLIQCFGICAELSKAFHIDLNNDEEEPILPEYTQPLYFTYEHETNNFLSDPFRYGTESDIKEHMTNSEHFNNMYKKLDERKREIIRFKAEWALKHMPKK